MLGQGCHDLRFPYRKVGRRIVDEQNLNFLHYEAGPKKSFHVFLTSYEFSLHTFPTPQSHDDELFFSGLHNRFTSTPGGLKKRQTLLRSILFILEYPRR